MIIVACKFSLCYFGKSGEWKIWDWVDPENKQLYSNKDDKKILKWLKDNVGTYQFKFQDVVLALNEVYGG